MTNLENNKEYTQLVSEWKQAKEKETLANAHRVLIEKQLLEITKSNLQDKGTNNLPNNLQIVTGYSESYDQDAIDRLKNKFDDGLSKLPYFPFKQEWKPQTKQIAALKDMCGEIFNQEMAEALTIKPKKPAFKIKESK